MDKKSKYVWQELEDELKPEYTINNLDHTLDQMSRFIVDTPSISDTKELASKLNIHWQKMNIAQDNRIKNNRNAPDLFSTAWQVLLMLRPQIKLLSRSFLLMSLLIMLLGGWMSVNIVSDTLHPLLFASPLLAALSVCFLFRSYGTPMFQLEMTFPLSPIQIIFGRLTIIVGYNMLLTFMVLLIFGGASASIQLSSFIVNFMLSWLIPLGLCSFIALAVMLHFGVVVGLVASLTFWTFQLFMGTKLGPLFFFSHSNQLFWMESKIAGLLIIIALLTISIRKAKLLTIPGRLVG